MTVLDIQVASNEDDGHWLEGSGNIVPGASVSLVGYFNDTSGRANQFARYTGVDIPNSMIIDVAYERSKASSDNSASTVNARMSAIDADNASAPTTYTGAENASRTSEKVFWNNIPSWSQNVTYNYPSIVSIIQEIVDRPGWAPGNAIVLLMEDSASTGVPGTDRRRYTHNSNPANASILHVEFVSPNTVPTITIAPTVTYGSLTRLGPYNTPAGISFTATDPEQTGSNALSYTIRTAASGGGTLVGSGTCTSGAGKTHDIANSASGLVDGTQTLYLRVYDGTTYSADSSFTLLRDTGAPSIGTITHSPNPVVN